MFAFFHMFDCENKIGMTRQKMSVKSSQKCVKYQLPVNENTNQYVTFFSSFRSDKPVRPTDISYRTIDSATLSVILEQILILLNKKT